MLCLNVFIYRIYIIFNNLFNRFVMINLIIYFLYFNFNFLFFSHESRRYN